ncbi:MAG: hypothetical protein LBG26_03765 [Treponema sp.]|jgi:hypothetical protein|nr:hypothetical protein [Treponema sp.]
MKHDAETVTALIRRRIESRYRRIRFVHQELAKINAKTPPGTVYGGSFEDLVFSTIDFSVYCKIDAEEFSLLFDEGLADFDETFYQKAFKTNRENIRETIFRFYLKAGPFYVCRKTNPLILSIMRSLHTSLEFAPLFAMDDFAGDSTGRAEQYRAIIAALDGVVIRHDDGMETRLFTRGPKANAKTEEKTAPLWGTFYPLGKAHTIPLL